MIQRLTITADFSGIALSAILYEISDDKGRYVKHVDHVAEVARWAEALRAVLYNVPHKSQARHVARALLEQYDKEAASGS